MLFTIPSIIQIFNLSSMYTDTGKTILHRAKLTLTNIFSNLTVEGMNTIDIVNVFQ